MIKSIASLKWEIKRAENDIKQFSEIIRHLENGTDLSDFAKEYLKSRMYTKLKRANERYNHYTEDLESRQNEYFKEDGQKLNHFH